MNNNNTKKRLLDKAETLFAKKGYREVTVRDIIHAARCNLAAINYHFGNKENLYLEVFRSRWIPRIRQVHDAFRKTLSDQEDQAPGTVIRALAEAFLLGPLSDKERERHIQLLLRELSNPTGVFKVIEEEVMHPFFKEVADTLKRVLPEGLDQERLVLSVISILAMVHHFTNARRAVSHVTGRSYDGTFQACLIDHIVRFSLKGLGILEAHENASGTGL